MHCLRILLIVSVALFSATGTIFSKNSDKESMSVGLVLSGGGAKGIAHIGVIRALEEHNIPIDYVAGTSMGAIIGGLYAAGYTPDEMMKLITSKDFTNWSTGQIDEKLTYYFFKEEKTPTMLNVSLPTKNDSTTPSSILPSSLISPLPMNFAFMELFSGFTAQCGGDFNKLFVPLRTVTSDVYRKHKIVCRNGSLGDAIRASMSFPVVFHPIEMDSVLVYDGGIYDNFPVDVMKADFAPDIMIGVDVSNPDGKPKANDILQQLEDMIIQNNDYSLPDEEGIKLKINLQRFSLLDFAKAPQIEQIGYDHAMSMMDSILTRIPTRIPSEERKLRRQVFKSRTPYVRFDSIIVSGGKPRQNKYFKNIFAEHTSDTFGLAHAKDAYYRAITGGKLKNLVPEAIYRPADDIFTLRLKANVKDNLNVGFGGYITSSTNSMIFLSGGYNSLSLNHFETKLNAWIGQSYMGAQAYGKIYFSSGHPSSLTADAVLWRMNFNSGTRFFYEQNPTSVSEFQAFTRLRFGIACGRNGKAEASIGFGHLNYRYYPTELLNNPTNKRNSSMYNLGQFAISFDSNTLDNQSYPTAGHLFKTAGKAMAGAYHHFPTAEQQQPKYRSTSPWLQFDITSKNYFTGGSKFSFGLETQTVCATRSLPTTYDQAIVTAPEYYPTAPTFSTINPDFRAYSYIAGAVVPIIKLSENLQLRTTGACFLPMRRIKSTDGLTPCYGKWFSDPKFFGQIAAVYNFPFASLSVYGNYIDAPTRKWNCGISFGLFFLAPKFL